MAESPRIRRRLFVADLALALAELGVIGYPLYDAYTLDEAQRRVLLSSAPTAVLVAGIVWYLALRAWLLPLHRVSRHKAGIKPDPDERAAAWDAFLKFPFRTLTLRVALFAVCGLVLPAFLHLRAGFPLESTLTVFAICTAHSFGVSTFRALWY